jgi:1-pyrroline-5-carboxylate dehydrogenase
MQQVVTEYSDSELPAVLGALERMEHHLTAAVVSNDSAFLQHVLGNTVNGTTYAGIRARTTGVPCSVLSACLAARLSRCSHMS